MTKRFSNAIVAMALAGGLSAVVAATPARSMDLFASDAFQSYSPDVGNGAYMMAAAGCAACHAGTDDPTVLSGGVKMENAIGEFHTPNISAHPSSGIGGWTNAQFLNAVMRGVSPEGRDYMPVFPYTAYAGLDPEDVLDIKAYIETLPQSDNIPPESKIGLLWQFPGTIQGWKLWNFNVPAFVPGDDSQMARGRYLVEAAGHCAECHTPRNFGFGLDLERKMQGEMSLTGTMAPDLLPARLLEASSAQSFADTVLGGGMKLSQSPITDPVMAHLSRGWGALTLDDKNAIYAYLTGKDVTAPPPPDMAQAQCGVSAPVQTASAGGSGGALAQKANAFMDKYCRSCHGPGQSAQSSYPTGDLASIAADLDFVVPGESASSRLFTVVTSGRMPMGSKPDDAEIQALADWIDALAPPDPVVASLKPQRSRDIVAFDDMIVAAQADLDDVNKTDRPFVRYFEMRPTYNAVFPCETDDQASERIAYYRAGFLKLLNSLSNGPRLVAPEAVAESKGLLLRIDLRDLDWTSGDYEHLVAQYPYGIDPRSDGKLKGLALETGTGLPIMRADWFMSVASQPENYAILLHLPDHIATLEQRMGVDATANIVNRRVMRAAMFRGASGVSDHNRMIERHDLPGGGYYWKSYDFAGDVKFQDMRQFPHGPEDIGALPFGMLPFEHDGGEMIFSLPNGLQGYYLSTAAGEAIQEGPTSIVSFRQNDIGKGVEIVNGRSCFACHTEGVISKRDEMRVHIESVFSVEIRDYLLGLYATQEDLDAQYDDDRAYFVNALREIGAAEATGGSNYRSLVAPDGRTEIVTWYANLFEEDMDYDAIAAEFEMTPDIFEAEVGRIADPVVQQIAIGWLNRLKRNQDVPRAEVSAQFPYLIGLLSDRRPLGAYYQDDYQAAPVTPPRYETARADGQDAGKLKLSLNVGSTTVRVGDLLSIELVANRDCELQMFYVQENGEVVEFPAEYVGEPFLKAGIPKHLPDPNSPFVAEFTDDALRESLVAYCRVGGLGDRRVSEAGVLDLMKKAGAGAGDRELTFKLVERAKQEDGLEAVQLVRFEVLPAGEGA